MNSLTEYTCTKDWNKAHKMVKGPKQALWYNVGACMWQPGRRVGWARTRQEEPTARQCARRPYLIFGGTKTTNQCMKCPHRAQHGPGNHFLVSTCTKTPLFEVGCIEMHNTTIWVESHLEWVYHRPYPGEQGVLDCQCDHISPMCWLRIRVCENKIVCVLCLCGVDTPPCMYTHLVERSVFCFFAHCGCCVVKIGIEAVSCFSLCRHNA